jgi:acyl-CoA dehydrogenase
MTQTDSFRFNRLTRPAFRFAKKAMPPMSATESEAVEAGDVWWDAELFTGNPDWKRLLETPPARLTPEEEAFVAGPVESFCAMLDDWRITWTDRDLPPDAWDFLKANRFFGMIIPKAYGGLGFSAYAHSEVVRKISTRSVAAAVVTMVPNSLGPGELLMQFGTDAQRDYWLPRLADGREVPCFGLTSPEAGSDAAAMTDTGIVCREVRDGQEVLGIRLNWHKRYITLGPVATILGLAFKLYDPEHLLGGDKEIGITVALVRADAPGVEIGRRHIPCLQMFQNGPNSGRDVFIPLDDVIGGRERVGQGWRMLMSALAAGAHDRRLCAHPRTISRADRQVRGRAGETRAHCRNRLCGRCRAAPHLRQPRSRPPPRGHFRHHEIARYRTYAHRTQRCDGRPCRQSRHRRTA